MSWFFNFRLGPLKGHAERFSAVGKDASFQCLSPLGTCANITWHRGNESFMSPIDVNVYQDFRQSVTDKYVLTEAWIGCVLILRDAQLDDAGPYLCRAMDYSFLFATELYVVGKLSAHFAFLYIDKSSQKQEETCLL